jgi:hypothetical protein
MAASASDVSLGGGPGASPTAVASASISLEIVAPSGDTDMLNVNIEFIVATPSFLGLANLLWQHL